MPRALKLSGAIAILTAVIACDPTGPGAPYVIWSGRAAAVDSNGNWDTGSGLQGAAVTAYVYEAGSTVGTSTDENGDFDLRIPSPDSRPVECERVYLEVAADGFQPYRASLLDAGESDGGDSQGCPVNGTIHSFLVLPLACGRDAVGTGGRRRPRDGLEGRVSGSPAGALRA